MYRILVPLDGSKFGEQALAAANTLANGEKVELKLMHAVDFVHATEDSDVQNEAWLHTSADSDAERYLEKCAAGVKHDSRPVSTAVTEGLPAEMIMEEARRWHADLIVMSTHGFGPLDRAWLGSVADTVVRNSSTPVVLVRPGQERAASRTRAFTHILVPLDGSALAEQALEPAIKLAHCSHACLTLLRVVHLLPVTDGITLPTQPPLLPDSTLPLRKQQAQDYLTRIAQSLRSKVGEVGSAVIVAAAADASEIIAYASAHDVDLIALATHGRSGLKRLVLGSVADKVIRGATVPVLVIHPDAEDHK